jgi:peroxiredoxin
MITLFTDQGTTTLNMPADPSGLWVAEADAAGWVLKPEGLCHGPVCVPIPPGRTAEFAADGRINLARLWRHLDRPVVHSPAGDVWVLGTSAADRAAPLRDLAAPDFELPDLAGRMHRLSDQRGRKVLLVTWASWCGCRFELPHWQTLYQELQDRGFMVVAVAMDSRPDAARQWIEAAQPTYVSLIDREHRVAELYAMVNVPQAVWIDETGRIVRPVESAGYVDYFRKMDYATRTLPPDAVAMREDARRIYLDAVRDWVRTGTASPFAYDPEEARRRTPLPTPGIALASANFQLGRHLYLAGRTEEAGPFLREAHRLHPDSWSFWRQAADLEEVGKASGPEFRALVQALGDRKYYTPADMPGMPG